MALLRWTVGRLTIGFWVLRFHFLDFAGVFLFPRLSTNLLCFEFMSSIRSLLWSISAYTCASSDGRESTDGRGSFGSVEAACE